MRLVIEFENLTSDELHNLLELEHKMKVTNGKMTGSGCYLPTRTRDWCFEITEKSEL